MSIVLPVRNEERYIRECLLHLLEQDYPADQYEILVVDGDSTDNTRRVVQELQEQVGPGLLRLLHNGKRIVPAALNIGIREARGSLIVRMDGHTVPETDYLSSCVRASTETGAANVGGPMLPVGEGDFGEAAAAALQHPLGVGDARFHMDGQAGFVDTVYMGAFRRDVFTKTGLFDESMVRNQDYEMNVRIRSVGERIYLDPRIRSRYTPRGTLRALWKQYFEYGWWRVETIRRHRWSARWRQLLPSAFVLGLLGLTGLAFVSAMAAAALALVVGTYLTAITAAAIQRRQDLRPEVVWRLPAAFVAMHVSYGLGFLLSAVTAGNFPYRAMPPAVPQFGRQKGTPTSSAPI